MDGWTELAIKASELSVQDHHQQLRLSTIQEPSKKIRKIVIQNYIAVQLATMAQLIIQVLAFIAAAAIVVDASVNVGVTLPQNGKRKRCECNL